MDIDVKIKLNVVLFSRPDGTLGKLPLGIEGRVSKKTAEEFLIGKSIPYETVFQVKKEDFKVSVNTEDLKEID